MISKPSKLTAIRTTITALGISGAALVGLAVNEGYVSQAMQPLPGDRWTYGFGSTTRADGAAVQPGDKTNPVAALQRMSADVAVKEGAVKECVHVPLYQWEYDAYMDLAYNIGTTAFCRSTLVKKLNDSDYVGACYEILRFDRYQGKPHPVLAKRRQQEFVKCMGTTND